MTFMRKRSLSLILGLSILLYALHYVALRYNLYFNVSWSDSVMHTLGGVVVAAVFCFTWMFVLGKRMPSVSKILFFTLVVGIVWEVFEAMSGMTMVSNEAYSLDTTFDIFFDLFGAYIFTILNKDSSNG